MDFERDPAGRAPLNGAATTRIALRIVGLLLVGLAAPQAIASVLGVISLLAYPTAVSYYPGYSMTDYLIGYVVEASGPLVQFALGIYLLAAGNGIMRICLSGLDQTRCARCGYAHAVAHDSPCPECGFRGLPVNASEAAPSEVRPGD